MNSPPPRAYNIPILCFNTQNIHTISQKFLKISEMYFLKSIEFLFQSLLLNEVSHLHFYPAQREEEH